jgi:hypothetical protein
MNNELLYEPHFKLQLIIEDLQKKLQNYAQKSDAKQTYIDSQNNLISKLYDVLNGIENFKNYDIWLQVETIIKNNEEAGNELHGYTIYLPVCKNPDLSKFCLINLIKS